VAAGRPLPAEFENLAGASPPAPFRWRRLPFLRSCRYWLYAYCWQTLPAGRLPGSSLPDWQRLAGALPMLREKQKFQPGSSKERRSSRPPPERLVAHLAASIAEMIHRRRTSLLPRRFPQSLPAGLLRPQGFPPLRLLLRRSLLYRRRKKPASTANWSESSVRPARKKKDSRQPLRSILRLAPFPAPLPQADSGPAPDSLPSQSRSSRQRSWSETEQMPCQRA